MSRLSEDISAGLRNKIRILQPRLMPKLKKRSSLLRSASCVFALCHFFLRDHSAKLRSVAYWVHVLIYKSHIEAVSSFYLHLSRFSLALQVSQHISLHKGYGDVIKGCVEAEIQLMQSPITQMPSCESVGESCHLGFPCLASFFLNGLGRNSICSKTFYNAL